MGLHAHAASQETPGNAATSTLTRLVVFHPPPRRPWGPIIRLPPFSFPVILPVASSDRSSLPSICPDLPSFTTNLQASFPTLQHVSKVARDRWARALSECLSAVCVAPADLSCWSKVFMLAKCVLASPATGHRLRWREILKLVRSRIDRWLA